MARPKKNRTLSVNERQSRHIEKLKSFGLKRVYFTASQSELILIDRLCKAEGMDKGELFLTLLRRKAASKGIHLKQIQAELSNGSS